MLNLIRRDLSITYKIRDGLFYMVFLMPLIILFLSHKDGMETIVMSTFLLTHILTLNPFSHEEKYKPHTMIQSLPITRKDTVVSRYLLIFLNLILAHIYVYLSSKLIRFMGFDSPTDFNISSMKLGIFTSIAFASLVLPIYFGLVTKAANIIGNICFIIVLNSILGMNFTQYSQWVLGLGSICFFLITLTIYLLSIVASINLYNRRDLD